jgi:hypothetical protein
MATGSLDTNGVWNYGEDDSIALFSDLLNLGTTSISDAFTVDRARLSTIESNQEATSTFVAASAAARDSRWGVPTTIADQRILQNLGARTVRTDTGFTEQYFASYNATNNPGGAASAGWYPVAGSYPYARLLKSNTFSTSTGLYQVPWTSDTSKFFLWSSAAPTKIFPNYRGLWRVSYFVKANIPNDYWWGADVSLNGVREPLSADISESNAVNVASLRGENIFTITNPPTDYLELNIFAQRSGDATIANSFYFQAEYLGPSK